MVGEGGLVHHVLIIVGREGVQSDTNKDTGCRGVGDQGARLLLVLVWADLLVHIGGVVARRLLLVLGGGVAGGGRVVVRTAAQAHGVLRS